jgi:hypothetical protein
MSIQRQGRSITVGYQFNIDLSRKQVRLIRQQLEELLHDAGHGFVEVSLDYQTATGVLDIIVSWPRGPITDLAFSQLEDYIQLCIRFDMLSTLRVLSGIRCIDVFRQHYGSANPDSISEFTSDAEGYVGEALQAGYDHADIQCQLVDLYEQVTGRAVTTDEWEHLADYIFGDQRAAA